VVKKSHRPWIATDRSMSNIRWNNVIFFSKNEGMMQQCQSRLGGMTAVSSHICGVLPRRRRAAHRLEPPSSGIRPFLADGAARLRLGTTRRSSLHLERRGAPNAKAARQCPTLPCQRGRALILDIKRAEPTHSHISQAYPSFDFKFLPTLAATVLNCKE